MTTVANDWLLGGVSSRERRLVQKLGDKSSSGRLLIQRAGDIVPCLEENGFKQLLISISWALFSLLQHFLLLRLSLLSLPNFQLRHFHRDFLHSFSK